MVLRFEIGISGPPRAASPHRNYAIASIPGLAAVKARIKEELQKSVGEDVELDDLPDLVHMGSVEDFWASFEWSAGGLLHAHIAFWMVGAPRLDKIIVPKETGANVIEVEVKHEDDCVAVPQEGAVTLSTTSCPSFCS